MKHNFAWSYLPNATHIDRVLASVKAHPDKWTAAYDAARVAARAEAWNAARGAGRAAASGRQVRMAARYAAQEAARGVAWDAATRAAYNAAWDTIATLIAWDHAEKYLDMTPDLLHVWHELSEDPACLLLIPYAHAQELIAAKKGVKV